MPQPSPGSPPASESNVHRVLRQHGPMLLAIEGVEGIAAGRTATGEDAVTVFLHDASVAASVPSELDGVPVQTIVTGTIDAL
jgi:hypothetical protein